MLHMPRALILHEAFLPLPQDLAQQRGDVRLVAELFDRREQRFEVEDDGPREGQPPQRLPVDAQVDAREGQLGGLHVAVGFVRVAGGHEEWGVEFEAP